MSNEEHDSTAVTTPRGNTWSELTTRLCPFARGNAVAIAAVAIAVALMAGVPANGTVIDFDDVPAQGQSIAYDRYKSAGVLLGSTGLALEIKGGSWTNTLPNALGTIDGNGSVVIEFVLPGTTMPGVVSTVSFYIVTWLSQPSAIQWAVEAYDLAGNPAGSIARTSGPGFVTFAYDHADIHRVVYSPLANGQAMDTLTFDTVVPEPVTVLLLTGAIFFVARGPRRS